MDRPLDVRIRRLALARQVLVPLGALALVFVAFLLAGGAIAPSVRRGEIVTTVVERGPIEATVTAAGTVVPEYEHVITSPIESRVARILLAPGATVRAGQPIVRLDLGEARAATQKLDDQIALKQNQREEALLESAQQRTALGTRREIQALQLKSLELVAERCQRYLPEGLFTKDEARKAEADAEKARIELREIEESLANLEATQEKRLRGIDLEMAILRRERAEAGRHLAEATASSDRAGVLTWVVPKEGQAIRRGDELARVADLSSFRVEATISDVHAARLSPGQRVLVESGTRRLTGRVTRIRPTVESGAVTFDVGLDDKANAILRHNLRVDVYVVTDRAQDAVRVKRGPYMTPDGTHAVFVVRGDRAVRTPVQIGLANVDHYQVLAGLAPGDRVIVSDMSRHMGAKEVRIR